MRTTAFLTLTGTGTVIREWLNQITTGSVAAPELLLLGIAVLGLGLQTLHSHRSRVTKARSQPTAPSTPALHVAATSA